MRSLREHLDAPSLGEPPIDRRPEEAATEGCAGGSCGVLANYWLEVDATGVITNCTARVRGRAAAFATASALCEAAVGRSVLDASRLGLTTLHPSFAELDAEDEERALVAEDGFHHVLGRWMLERMRAIEPGATGAARPTLPAAVPELDRVRAIVGMSGGVDSAVAIHRAAEQHDGRVVGATLRLWIDPRAPDPDAACCSPDSVRRARSTCHAAGLPHLSIDLREEFARAVVVPFVAEYAMGGTPNPCVRCNGTFRLDELVRLADVVGAQEVVTGHYARIVERAGVSLVARGVDRTKDQSYMLASVEPATAARLRFPLGEEHKTAIRGEAAERGLEQATTPESQEVCFLGGGDYRTFLERAGALGKPGNIVLDDAESTVVGSHQGIARFTPGQRKGLGVAAAAPLYVLDVDPASGNVTVGSGVGLEQRDINLADVRWHAPDRPERVEVQLRYRSRGGTSTGTLVDDVDASQERTAVVRLDSEQRAPAPGQSAVFYGDDGVVLGIGRIVRTPALVDTRSNH
ncbi:MAG: tRNA-specific 2-thiouridylase MnmA [Thermoleophilia bacterium]|nr:tRNA-specific 2-thiouridylase MnmA [Thermoleophilia bacterium]